MNFTEIVKDLNCDMFSTFGEDSIQRGFKYTYQTDGGSDVIKFSGITLYDNDGDTSETDDLDEVEFKGWIINQLNKIGNLFLNLSFQI